MKRSALSRGKPLKRRTPLARTGTLRRKTPLARSNRPRRARMLALCFGEQAERCRRSPCCVCGEKFGPSDPHHEPTRARGGVDENTAPLCRRCHRRRHSIGRRAFEELHGVDLIAETEKMREAA